MWYDFKLWKRIEFNTISSISSISSNVEMYDFTMSRLVRLSEHTVYSKEWDFIFEIKNSSVYFVF